MSELASLFNPSSVALVGATDRSTWSKMAFDNLRLLGFQGRVHLVSRSGGLAHGQQTFTSVTEIGEPVDVALLMLPIAAMNDALRDLGAAGIRSAVVLAGGFAETGEEGRALQEELVATARELGIRLLGPNCLGFINFTTGGVCWTGSMRTPPLKGGIMAGEAACCLTLDEWRERFRHWIAQGSPQDLLNASIYFDFRPLAGDLSLAHALRADVVEPARSTPRFLKQLALNALTRSAPLNWRGAIDSDEQGRLDLKLRGTAIFVDAARIYSLAYGIQETNTKKRLDAAGPLLKLAETEYGSWVSGFEFLQMLRLRIQLESETAQTSPNEILVAELNDIDRRILRESLKVAHRIQQRLQLDYER